MNALSIEEKTVSYQSAEPQSSINSVPEVLADVYQDSTNIVVWKRSLSKAVESACICVIEAYPTLQLSLIVSPQEVESQLTKALDASINSSELVKNITNLTDMFSCLFDIKRVGLRLTVLNKAMCPKFHVDHVACRLVTTYLGPGTEWLPNNQRESSHTEDKIQYTEQGDVVLLKGEAWEGNEGNGIVHRSPSVTADEKRLLLTLDIVDM